MQRLFGALLLTLIAGTAGAHDTKLGDLTIMQPWARATAGEAKTGAVYLRIGNGGSQDDRLVAASTPAAAKSELHTHIMDNGVAKMRQVKAINVTAHATVELKPGGLHVMLIDLKQPLREHDSIPLTLTFERAGSVEVEVKVEKAGAAGSSD
jgi:copper(I)-binding protein